jgi:hypothetical protein
MEGMLLSSLLFALSISRFDRCIRIESLLQLVGRQGNSYASYNEDCGAFLTLNSSDLNCAGRYFGALSKGRPQLQAGHGAWESIWRNPRGIVHISRADAKF